MRPHLVVLLPLHLDHHTSFPKICEELAVEVTCHRIDVATAMAYWRDLPKFLNYATNAEKKQLIRAWVEDIRLTPEQREVAITYRVPEPVVNSLVTGARFEPATS